MSVGITELAKLAKLTFLHCGEFVKTPDNKFVQCHPQLCESERTICYDSYTVIMFSLWQFLWRNSGARKIYWNEHVLIGYLIQGTFPKLGQNWKLIS